MNVLAVDALACFRLTRLVVADSITESPREHLMDWLEDRGHSKLAELFRCPWCFGFWCALFVVAARRLFPRLWSPLALALAFSAVTGLLSERA